MKFSIGDKIECINDQKADGYGGMRKVLVTVGKTYKVLRYDNQYEGVLILVNDEGNEVPYSENRFRRANQWKGAKREHLELATK